MLNVPRKWANSGCNCRGLYNSSFTHKMAPPAPRAAQTGNCFANFKQSGIQAAGRKRGTSVAEPREWIRSVAGTSAAARLRMAPGNQVHECSNGRKKRCVLRFPLGVPTGK